MAVLTLLFALLAWLLAPFAPLVPFAQVGLIAVVSAFTIDERAPATGASSSVTVTMDVPATASNGPTCFGEPATMEVNGQENFGTDGDDVIVGGEGYDWIDAGPGDDLVCGGGNDQLYGGPGHDLLDGGRGNDWLHDREGEEDDLYGGPGGDRCEILSRGVAECEFEVIFD